MTKKPTYEELEQGIKELGKEVVEHKRAKEELQTILDVVPVMIFQKDRNGKTIRTNQTFANMIGLSKEEIIGKTTDELFPEHGKDMIKDDQEVMELEKPKLDIIEHYDSPEGTRWARTGKAPLKDKKGNVVGLIGYAVDITEQKQAEEALREKTHDLGERVKELNCLYGISRLVEKPGLSLEDILWGTADLIPPACQYSEIACARITLEDQEFRTASFKETTWKQTSEIPVHGKRSGAVEVFYLEERPESDAGPFLKEERNLIDAIAERLGRIIERVQVETALKKVHDELERLVKGRTAELTKTNVQLKQEIKKRKQAEKELKESTEKIRLFAYSVAHDLKSPAIGIYGLTKLLHKHYKGILDEKGKGYCDQILKASEQIVALVENINVYISTKETPLNIERVKLKEILQMVKEEISTQLSIRQIRWSEPEYIPEINVDRLSILRVVRNLVDNALKHGGDDLSEIKIGYEESNESHILSVSDGGIGIEDEDSRMIFGLFKRNRASREIEGTGLGLAIVKEIAEQHGGKVWVEPVPEKGPMFNISISKYL